MQERGKAIFVAGTDTGIGKTHVAAALVHALVSAGWHAAGMKPVASGAQATVDGLRNEDALILQAASFPPPAYAEVNPLAFAEPVAPHLAAARAGADISLAAIRPAYDRLLAAYDYVVVEGVGGWMVPLAPGLQASAIAMQWRLPVVLVVGLRLGCINHAQLTARAILADGCALVGWVGNRIDPAMALADENIQTLRELLPAPCLGLVEHGSSPAAAAHCLQHEAFTRPGISRNP